jgi:FKBP-type peptidyl-prolyl cis-trans isomerase
MYTSSYGIAFMLFFTTVSSAQSFSKKDSISYGMGLIMAEELKKSGIKDLDVKLMMKAIDDYLANNAVLNITQMKPIVNAYKVDLQKKSGLEFLAQNKTKPGVTTTASGLQYEILHKGASTQKPILTSRVTVHYHGTLPNGQIFDSSVNRGQPATFMLNAVIKGWQEGVQLMSIGDKYKFYIPQELAYGARGSGSGSIPPYAALVFEVELLSIDDSK